MKNGKFLYIYVDQDEIIKEIETSAKDFPELIEYLLPIDQGKDFLALKEKWAHSYSYRAPYILTSEDGQLSSKEVIYVYYEKRKKTIKSISAIPQDYLDKNDNLIRGRAERTELTDGFMDKKPFHNYRIEEDKPLLQFIEYVVSLDDDLKDISLLRNSKIEFVTQDPWVRITYNRKRKEIEISRIGDLGVGELYFSKKHDVTTLYTCIKVEYEPKTSSFKNVVLPEEFDVYNLRDEQNRFSYEEIQ